MFANIIYVVEPRGSPDTSYNMPAGMVLCIFCSLYFCGDRLASMPFLQLHHAISMLYSTLLDSSTDHHCVNPMPVTLFPHSPLAFAAECITTEIIWTNTAAVRTHGLATSCLISIDAISTLQECWCLPSIRKELGDLLYSLVRECSSR